MLTVCEGRSGKVKFVRGSVSAVIVSGSCLTLQVEMNTTAVWFTTTGRNNKMYFFLNYFCHDCCIVSVHIVQIGLVSREKGHFEFFNVPPIQLCPCTRACARSVVLILLLCIM